MMNEYKWIAMKKVEGTLDFPKSHQKTQKILYIVSEYPQISQTYIHEEIVSLAKDYTIEILSLNKPDLTRQTFYPHYQECSQSDIFSCIETFTPDAIHSHYFQNIPLLEE